jgi:uncharacterized protein YvpB
MPLQEAQPEEPATPTPNIPMFEVHSQGAIAGLHRTYQEAVEAARGLPDSGVWKGGWVWDNRLPYAVVSEEDILYFDSLPEAAKAAEGAKGQVYLRRQPILLWDQSPLPEEVRLEAPTVLQHPELARGCEVSSLAMLLQSLGFDVGKMELAEKVAKDPAPYKSRKGVVTFGDPNLGFVGSMDNPKLDGYGVYNGPIFELLKKYLPARAVNLTGCEFSSLQKLLAQGSPVWVITNATFAPLPEKEFVYWNTTGGQIKATYKEHSVLITGYDKRFAYFNDPLSGPSKADLEDFRDAWAQMGSQAVSAAR